MSGPLRPGAVNMILSKRFGVLGEGIHGAREGSCWSIGLYTHRDGLKYLRRVILFFDINSKSPLPHREAVNEA